MASIENREPGRWKVRYRSPDGRQRSKTFARKADATRFATTVEADVIRGQWTDPAEGRRSFGEVARAWQDGQVHNESTAALVDGVLRLHILPTFEDRPIAAIRPSEIQVWVKGRGGELAPSTLRVAYRWLAAIFNAAVLDGVIPRTPCRGVRLPAVEVEPVDPLTIDQVKAIALAIPERYRAMVIVAAATGLRQGEVFGLGVEHVDFLRRQLHVRRQVKYLPGKGPHLAPPKTPASRRTVPLPEVALVALAEHLRQAGQVGQVATAREGGLIFADTRGGPIARNPFNVVWRKAVAVAGLPEGTGFHDLRHHYASVLIRAGESVKVVQARLGHKSALETLNTYSHLWPDSEESTRTAVDQAWAPVSPMCPGQEAEGL